MALCESVLAHTRVGQQERRLASPRKVKGTDRAAEDMLRELAFVYHATRAVRQAIQPSRST